MAKKPKKSARAIPASKPSHVAQHVYNSEKRELTITFDNGRMYRYADVKPELARGLTKALSRGTYLHSHIIPHHTATEVTNGTR